jgi:NTP pyrophosphatase (non-canonical NTP hydrolase)
MIARINRNIEQLNKCTVKEWMSSINEEVTELHEAIISYEASNDGRDFNNFVEEATDVITVITSMLAACECTEEDRMDAQRKVNLKNEKRGRLC